MFSRCDDNGVGLHNVLCGSLSIKVSLIRERSECNHATGAQMNVVLGWMMVSESFWYLGLIILL